MEYTKLGHSDLTVSRVCMGRGARPVSGQTV